MKKLATQSITVTVSGDLARQLEEFAQVALTTPEELARSIVSAKFGQDQSLDILQECIVGRSAEYSEAQAKQAAENYDAFAVKDAERNGHPVRCEARVESRRGGPPCIWFPTIAKAA